MAAPLQSYSQKDFSLGLNSKRSAFLLDPREASDILNIDIDETRYIKKRTGFIRDPDSELSNPITGLFQYVKEDGNKYFLCASGTDIYKEDAGSWTSIKSGLTSGLRTNFINFRDRCFIANGTDALLKFDGSNVYTAGCQKPDASSMSATPTGSGTFSGTYKYKVTFLYDDYLSESEPCDEEISANASNHDYIALTDIPTGAGDVKKRKIYRTEDGGSVYYHLTTINDNTTTTYNDSTPDAQLGTDNPPTDAGIPPVCKYMCVKENRLIFAGNPDNPDYVYYSEILEPEVVKSTSLVKITTEGDDVITGIVNFQDNVIVFKKNSIWALLGSPSSWVKRNLHSSLGCAAPGSIQVTENKIIFLGTYKGRVEGVFSYDGAVFRRESDNIPDQIDDINTSYFDNICSSYYDKKYKISVTTSSGGGSVNDKTYQCTWVKTEFGEYPAWTIFSYGVNVFAARDADEYAGSAKENYCWKMHSGNSDRGLALVTKWQSGDLDFGMPNVTKDFREFSFDAYLPEGTLTLTFSVDNDRITKQKQIKTGAGEDGFYRKRFSLPFGLVGKRFKYKFEDAGTTGAFYIMSIDVKFRPIPRK